MMPRISKLIPGALLALTLVACEDPHQDEMVGTLERDRIQLSFETNEPIAVIHVADGAVVEAGDLLIEQDDQRMRLNVAQLEGERDLAAARLAEAVRGPREEDIRQARALLESAQAEAKNAAANLERTRGVFEKGLSTREAMDRAETRQSTAHSQVQAQQEALEALLNGTTAEELAQAEATLAATEAALATAQLSLERTRLYAPVDGRIDDVVTRLGERPAPGQVVAILLDSARTYARVYVPEPLKSHVVPGLRINVHIDGQDRTFEGTVRWISADASFTPYFALTEHDRSKLSYVAEIDIPAAADLPIGVPLVAEAPGSEKSED